MSWVDELTDYVRGLEIAGIDQNVFAETIPARVSPAAMLMRPITGTRIDHELPGYYRTRLQLVVRHEKSLSAETVAQAISDAFAVNSYGLETDNHRFNFIRPDHLPAVYPRSEGDFFEASVNFDVSMIRL